MQELDDIILLREYAERNSEEAFATLVRRHVNKVYSVAIRHTRNPHQAEEITQAVFVILAQKCRQLSPRVVLSGWLYQTARLTAVTFLRSEIRRSRREQESCMQNVSNESEPDVWPQIAPLLDAAMDRLNEKDRYAVVLRFFDGKSMKEIGAALGTSEDAAKMRVNRAVEKLQQFFSKSGVTSTPAAITGAISLNSIQIAPAALAGVATAVAIAKGVTASTSTLTLIKGALKIMAWTKAKSTIAIGLGIVLAAGTATVSVQKIAAARSHDESWRVPSISVRRLPDKPQMAILPTKFAPARYMLDDNKEENKIVGLATPLTEIAVLAYHGRIGRTIVSPEVGQTRYDFVAVQKGNATEALQKELKKRLGVVGKTELRETNVWFLKVVKPNASGLKPPVVGRGDNYIGKKGYRCDDMPISSETWPYGGLARFLEFCTGQPVIDQTGLTDHFSIDLQPPGFDIQHPDVESLQRGLRDQLGLELVPGQDSVEMLVLEKR